MKIRHLFRSIKNSEGLRALVVGMVAAQGTLFAQSGTAAQTSPAYEVVSVKVSPPSCRGMSIGVQSDRLTARCITVWGLIYNAYAVQSMREHPPGLPGWGDSALFDVDAKIDEDTAKGMEKLPGVERGKLRQRMLQSLLADRFKLRVHNETSVQAIYELMVAKGGARLKEWPTDERPLGSSWGAEMITVKGGGVDQLAKALTDVLGRKVVNATGLTGNYDIALRWTPDDQAGTPTAGPPLLTALEEQLGLRVKAGRGPVETLVVDSVEKPAGN